MLCQSLAKRAGTVDSFLVDGRAFAAAELERCNASAKAAAGEALAANKLPRGRVSHSLGAAPPFRACTIAPPPPS